MFIQYLFGFLSLGWQVYKFVREQEKNGKFRKDKCNEFRYAIRKVKDEKDTRHLEDLFYDLGITGNDYGSKLRDKESSSKLGT